MDIFTIDFFEKLVSGQAFGTVLGLLVAYIFYRLYLGEKVDRKESWSKYNILLEKFLQVTGGNVTAIERNNDILEDNTKALEANKCRFLEKN